MDFFEIKIPVMEETTPFDYAFMVADGLKSSGLSIVPLRFKTSAADSCQMNEYLKKYVKSLYSELKKIDNPEEKKQLGKAINDFKNHCENVINTYIEKFKN